MRQAVSAPPPGTATRRVAPRARRVTGSSAPPRRIPHPHGGATQLISGPSSSPPHFTNRNEAGSQVAGGGRDDHEGAPHRRERHGRDRGGRHATGVPYRVPPLPRAPGRHRCARMDLLTVQSSQAASAIPRERVPPGPGPTPLVPATDQGAEMPPPRSCSTISGRSGRRSSPGLAIPPMFRARLERALGTVVAGRYEGGAAQVRQDAH